MFCMRQSMRDYTDEFFLLTKTACLRFKFCGRVQTTMFLYWKTLQIRQRIENTCVRSLRFLSNCDFLNRLRYPWRSKAHLQFQLGDENLRNGTHSTTFVRIVGPCQPSTKAKDLKRVTMLFFMGITCSVAIINVDILNPITYWSLCNSFHVRLYLGVHKHLRYVALHQWMYTYIWHISLHWQQGKWQVS